MVHRRAPATQFTRGVLWHCLMGRPSHWPNVAGRKYTERVPVEAPACVLTLLAQQSPRNKAILTPGALRWALG